MGLREDERLLTLKRDRIPWDIKPVPARVVALGDVHGDLEGMVCILGDRSLIDKKGHWTGEDTHLVLNGDLVGGRNARLLLQFVTRLRKEAAAAGGAIHALLGNHDVQVFNKEYEERIGRTLFEQYGVTGARDASPAEAFKGDTPFALWLRRRNSIIRIGSTIFTHAGLNTWALRHHPARINATVRAWIRYWQGVGEEPDMRTLWAALGPQVDWSPSSTGPLWTRSFKVKSKKKKAVVPEGAPAPAEVALVLKKYRARRMVIGHNPLPGGEILLSHPHYGDQVVMIDTRISDQKGGVLSCLEIRGGELEAHYPARDGFGEKIRERELKRLKKRSKRKKS